MKGEGGREEQREGDKGKRNREWSVEGEGKRRQQRNNATEI